MEIRISGEELDSIIKHYIEDNLGLLGGVEVFTTGFEDELTLISCANEEKVEDIH